MIQNRTSCASGLAF